MTTPSVVEIDPFKNYSDLRKIGIWSLVAAAISWIVFGAWLSIMAALYGAYGAYLSISQKERLSTVILNLLAVVVAVASKLALMKASSGEFIIGYGSGQVQFKPLTYMLVVWMVVLLGFIIAWQRSPHYQQRELAANSTDQPAPIFSSGVKQAFIVAKILFYVVVIGTGWYLIHAITELRRWLYASSDTLTLLVPGFPSLAMFLPIVLITLILGVSLRKVIARFFPEFDQFYSLKNYVTNRTVGLSKEKQQEFWNEAIKRIDLSKLADSGWRGMFAYCTFSWILFGITFIPLMDCYVKVSPGSIVANPLMGLREVEVPWEGLSAKVEMIPHRLLGRKAQFTMRGTDGTKIDLWACVGLERSNSKDLLKIIPVFRDHHVPMVVTPPAWIPLSGESEERIKLVKEVFEEAQKAAK